MPTLVEPNGTQPDYMEPLNHSDVACRSTAAGAGVGSTSDPRAVHRTPRPETHPLALAGTFCSGRAPNPSNGSEPWLYGNTNLYCASLNIYIYIYIIYILCIYPGRGAPSTLANRGFGYCSIKQGTEAKRLPTRGKTSRNVSDPQQS